MIPTLLSHDCQESPPTWPGLQAGRVGQATSETPPGVPRLPRRSCRHSNNHFQLLTETSHQQKEQKNFGTKHYSQVKITSAPLIFLFVSSTLAQHFNGPSMLLLKCANFSMRLILSMPMRGSSISSRLK